MGTLSSPTLQELITNVRLFLGESDSNNSRWTDPELVMYLNDGARVYWGEVVQNCEGQFTTTTTLDIVSGTETVALPTDFFAVKNLWKKVNSDYIPCEYQNTYDTPYTTAGGTNSAYVFDYSFRGNNLVLRNTPTASETAGLLLEYIQFPTTLTLFSDTLSAQIVPVFKNIVEMYAVYKAKVAESIRGNNIDTYSAIERHLGQLYTQFRDVIRARSNAPSYVKPFNP